MSVPSGNNANSEISVDAIQEQVDNCDSIVALIDKIVPKLYKVRQQALSQKEYINDVNRVLLTNGMDSKGFEEDLPANKRVSLTDSNPVVGTSILSAALQDKAFKQHRTEATEGSNLFANTALQRQVFQSLIKYKHDAGTENHFTTDQIGTAEDRTHGLNLSDVKTLLTGINGLMKHPNKPTAISSTVDLKLILLKSKERLSSDNTSRVQVESIVPKDDKAGQTKSQVALPLVSTSTSSYQYKSAKLTNSNNAFEATGPKYEYVDLAEGLTGQLMAQQEPAPGDPNPNKLIQGLQISQSTIYDNLQSGQYLSSGTSKGSPASLLETIPDRTAVIAKLGGATDDTKAKILARNDTDNGNSTLSGIDLGIELSDPWDTRHKYVGFGLGD